MAHLDEGAGGFGESLKGSYADGLLACGLGGGGAGLLKMCKKWG